MSVVPNLDLRPDHWAIVRDALRRHVPDREVLAFGSRATWTAKDYSDLDLAIMGEEPLSLRASSALDEALVESDLPFRVDIVDWASTDESFRRIIRRGAVSVQAPTMTPEVAQRVGIRSTTPVARGSSEQETKEGKGGLFSPTFPEHWRPSPLYAMATWVNGLAFRKIQFSETGRPIVKIAELKGGVSGQTKFTQQTFDESVCVRPGDLLFSWSGQPETSIDAFWWRGPEGWLNQHVFRVTPELGLDVTFFYYLLRYLKPNFVRIARNKQTTGLGHVTKRDLKNLRVASPDRPEQRAIAHVLGTLDDKIELNRRMNETLEAMTGALFKSWFVDFDPVRAKIAGRDTGLPRDIADLFPDRLVDSEMGEIPEGWQVVPLDGIARFQNGLALQRFRPGQNEDRLPVVKIAQMRAGEANSGEWASAAIKPECVIEDGDVLFSWSGSLLVMMWCGGRAALNQHLFRVTSDRYPKWFYLHSLLFHLPAFRQIAQDKATTMGHIRRHHLTEALCVSPPDGVIAELSDTFSCLLDRQVATELSSRTLAAVRDTLLPKLISGEIRLLATDQGPDQ